MSDKIFKSKETGPRTTEVVIDSDGNMSLELCCELNGQQYFVYSYLLGPDTPDNRKFVTRLTNAWSAKAFQKKLLLKESIVRKEFYATCDTEGDHGPLGRGPSGPVVARKLNADLKRLGF